MDIESQAPAKTLIIQFHLSIKNDWLADFSRSYTSHHSHKKRKDSLETRVEPAVFSL